MRLSPQTWLRNRDVLAHLVLCALVIAFFWRVLFSDSVLLPADALYSTPPWSAYADQFSVDHAHNDLIADMILQNYSWKTFARDSIHQGQVPLWNPYVLSGVPFLAAGQYAVLYPLGIVFYVLPVGAAYGYFTALHILLAGVFTYWLARALGAGWAGSLVAAISFMFGQFLIVSFVWPMILSTAIYLPLLLLLVELAIRRSLGEGSWSPSLLIVVPLTALAVALQFLAGHLEISFYVLFSMAFYSAARLSWALVATRAWLAVLRAGLLLAGAVGVGFLTAAVQLLPFYEVIRENFRAGSVSYDQVVGWALPKARIATYLLPDLFGNPSRHTVFDPLTLQSLPIRVQQGERVLSFIEVNPAVFKNYVEGAGYVGLLPLLLAPLGVVLTRHRFAMIFGAYAALCVLLAFGTPLYWLLWQVPGVDQLRTPFRWMLPLSLCLAVLAGLGVNALLSGLKGPARRRVLFVCSAALAVAVSVLLLLVVAVALPSLALGLAEAAMRRIDALRVGFGSARLLFAYEFQNVLLFGAILATSALAMLYAIRAGWRHPTRVTLALAAVLAADLFFAGYDFNSVTRPELARFIPPSLEFVRRQGALFRTVSFNHDDTLRPISNMLVGLQDVRGYDTIILKRYVDFWRLLEEPQGLLYSMINKLVDPRSLTSPLLDLMNVRFVLTTQNIALPGYREVHRGEINVYENEDVLPRAFVVGRTRAVADEAAALAVMAAPGFDPRRTVVLEGSAIDTDVEEFHPADVTSYQANQVEVLAQAPAGGYLVLADTFFPGWEASVDGRPAEIVRAYSIYRAVHLPPGNHSVVFRYSPLSFKLGLYVSFLGSLIVAIGLGLAGWRALQGRLQRATTIQRVAKNSIAPMAAQLVNRAVSFGFAIFMLRILGPEDAGKYALAVVLFGYFEILSDFGLGTLLTREIASERSVAGRHFGETLLLRFSLSLLSLPLLALLVAGLAWTSGLTVDTGVATLLLGASLLPGAFSAAATSLFMGYEQMEYPAAITVITNLMRVALGIAALLAGWGIVGLAAVSVVVSTLTAVIFLRLFRSVQRRMAFVVEWRVQLRTLGTAFPLMINNLLSSVFFRIDVMLLRLMQPGVGDLINGWYSTAYRFIDGLNFIPSFLTLALFPLMARFAKNDRERLLRGYLFSLKVLLVISMPITVGTTIIADRIIRLFFPPEFEPAILALQVLIWFLPFSFINSVTHYVLIALNLQRYLTIAFVIGVAANVLGNIMLIPRFSFLGAGVMTVVSEVILLLPFAYLIHRHLAPVPMLSLMARPLVAAFTMGFVTWWLHDAHFLVVLPASAAVYTAALLALRVFDRDEVALLKQLRTVP